MTLFCEHLTELPGLARKIINFAEDYRIWLLYGDMGVGKTTLTKAICEELGSADTISSPTFSLVNEYRDDENNEIYHFDFYRIESEIEAVEMGCDEYFYSDRLCLIEWPEKIPSLIPPKNMEISINLVEGNQREIRLIKND